MICKYCNSSYVHKDGNHNGYQRYKCLTCRKRFDGEKYESEFSSIVHFNTKLKKTENIKLTRTNYCVPKKEIGYKDKKIIQQAKAYLESTGKFPLLCPPHYCCIPNDIFEDEEHYTDKYVETHHKNCMKNFDLNMMYFDRLEYDEFNKFLIKFVKKHRFSETFDLTELRDKTGVYIMVLDEYKQVYIGISDSAKGIKGRILQHWSRKKEFGRLIFGTVETSILSIDCFGALDTTRIFYKELKWHQNLHEYEDKLVSEFKPQYRLNRVSGGLNAEEDSILRNIQLLAQIQKRELKL